MFNKELVAASSKPLVLSILAEEGESYGYAIIQKVRELSGGKLEWTDGMLYPVLHRLEREKLIESRWVVPETGRKRKYYTLQTSGKTALENEKQQWKAVDATLHSLWSITPTPKPSH
jgi:PadR family transcriptional regulator PadR